MSSGRLANLLIVGVPKAGTSSLFSYLAQHPDICGSDTKEIGHFNYFNPLRHAVHQRPSIESYMGHFAHCSGQRYALEATPSYCYKGQAVVDAIRELPDNPKVIVTLRNPTDRLWSDYTFQRSLGNIPTVGSFDEYLNAVEQHREGWTDLTLRSHLQGLLIGFYADYIPVWLEAFGRNARVVFTEDMARGPAQVLEELFRWLEIDPDISTLDLEARNVTAHARSPRVASVVYALKRAGDRLRVVPPGVRDLLRRAYLRVNTGAMPERLDPAGRHRVDAIYRSSNRTTAEALTAAGYKQLPAWLQHAADG